MGISDLRGRWRSCNRPDHRWPKRGSSSLSSASPSRQPASSRRGARRPPCWWLPWHSWRRASWQTIERETRPTGRWGEERDKRVLRWTKQEQIPHVLKEKAKKSTSGPHFFHHSTACRGWIFIILVCFYHLALILLLGNNGEVKKKDAKHVGVLFKSLWMRRRQFLASRETIFNRISLPPRPSHSSLPVPSFRTAVDGPAPLSHEGAP